VVADAVGGFVLVVVIIAIGRFGFGVGGGVSCCWFGFIRGRHRGHDNNIRGVLNFVIYDYKE